MTAISILRRAALPLALLAAFVGCAKLRPLTAPAAQRGNADFGLYVALGTNLSAGFQSGGLSQRHQPLSYPALFARQAGSARFSMPTVNLGGWPPLLKIRSFGPPLVLDSAGIRGAFVNPLTNPPALLDSAYANMSIPGAVLADVNDPALNYSTSLGRDVSFFFNIARQQGRPLPLSILQLAKSRRPTFVTFEYGLNEVLGPAAAGSGTPRVPTATWAGLLHVTLDSLDLNMPAAKKVIVDVPDVTTMPFFTTIPPFELTKANTPVISGGGPKYLLGPGGPLQAGDLVTLQAGRFLADTNAYGYALGDSSYYSGRGIAGKGLPLPGAVILSAAERVGIRDGIDRYNLAINAEAAARGYGVLKLHDLLLEATQNGFKFAGAQYTTRYVTGGLFSLDGLHPTDLFHGLICNKLINLVNSKYAARIPPLDLTTVMTPSSSSLARARGEGMPLAPLNGIPLWGLGRIGDLE